MSEVTPEFIHADLDGLTVRLQVGLYGADPIAQAAHRFTDRCFVHLEYEDDEHVLCRLQSRKAGDDLRTLAGEFTNEVLDQMLRSKLAAESEPTRLLLLAHAFSNTNILHPELDEEIPSQDPLKIGDYERRAK